jgi:hypothetical protein
LADAPWSLAYSLLPAPYTNAPYPRGDILFARPGTGALTTDGAWWGVDNTNGYAFLPGYDAAGQPNAVNTLFPSQPENFNNLTIPYQPGTPVAKTVRHASPAIAPAIAVNAANQVNPLDPDAYLMWQGQVDKGSPVGVGGPATQITETRTFYVPLANGVPAQGQPILSFLNDPAQTKLGPKPLFLKLPQQGSSPAINLLYLFWYSGGEGQTSLYYNFNNAPSGTTVFPPNNWSADRKLATPPALTWQSDPTPIYRRVWSNGQMRDVIDVVFTGVLKNRQTVETLLTRYEISRGQAGTPDGQLSAQPMPLGQVQQQTLSRVGSTHTYTAKDASWLYGDPNNPILIDMVRNINGVPTLVHLNTLPAVQTTPQRGRLDTGGGLVYYDVATRDDNGNLVNGANNRAMFGGGQTVVDLRSGTVSFPDVPPGQQDRLVATYTPLVMRLNTTRDESHSLLPQPIITDNNPHQVSPGNSTNPVAILDRILNPRRQLAAPQVVFPGSLANWPAETDRLWVLYRKSDPNTSVRGTLYYKAMRLLVRLPGTPQLTPPNNTGQQQIVNGNTMVTGNRGPYEVDWVRGRIYFTEADEGNTVRVSGTFTAGGNVINLSAPYQVAWGDEISAGGAPTADQPFADITTPEVIMPVDSAVNEGQVTAFKDPFADKLWLFWTSTRANTTDLYYQTIAPPFYSVPANQQ